MGKELRLLRRGVKPRVEELRRHLGLFSFDSDDRAPSLGRQGFSPEFCVRAGGIVEWLMAREGGVLSPLPCR